MKKLIDGIVEFRRSVYPGCRHKFEMLAKGQSPDSLFITCSDSRVAPNWFASTDPGDLFVVRNVGNMIPHSGAGGVTSSDFSEVAAVEFAIQALNVKDIIVCGHSECGAMDAVLSGRNLGSLPHLQSWLENGRKSYAKFSAGGGGDSSLSPVNQFSQFNVLEQIRNLQSYTIVSERLSAGTLGLHGWWFDIATAGVYSYHNEKGRFVLIE